MHRSNDVKIGHSDLRFTGKNVWWGGIQIWPQIMFKIYKKTESLFFLIQEKGNISLTRFVSLFTFESEKMASDKLNKQHMPCIIYWLYKETFVLPWLPKSSCFIILTWQSRKSAASIIKFFFISAIISVIDYTYAWWAQSLRLQFSVLFCHLQSESFTSIMSGEDQT